MTNPDSVMNEEAETKAIEKWLRMVDKPLTAKKGHRKETESQVEREGEDTKQSHCGWPIK